MIPNNDFSVSRFEYFKMNAREQKSMQRYLWEKINDLRDYYDERDGVITHISELYIELINKATKTEDYELCQALKDSAELNGILLDME